MGEVRVQILMIVLAGLAGVLALLVCVLAGRAGPGVVAGLDAGGADDAEQTCERVLGALVRHHVEERIARGIFVDDLVLRLGRRLGRLSVRNFRRLLTLRLLTLWLCPNRLYLALATAAVLLQGLGWVWDILAILTGCALAVLSGTGGSLHTGDWLVLLFLLIPCLFLLAFLLVLVILGISCRSGSLWGGLDLHTHRQTC
jgi:hypothetical protein